MVPLKLEDRFDELDEESEEEKKEQHLELDADDQEYEADYGHDEHQSINRLSAIQLARDRRAHRLGHYGLAADVLSQRKLPGQRPQPYSVSLLAAITQEAVVGAQLIEGGVDSSVFENFLNQVLLGLRAQGAFDGPGVVLLLDNARIHHHSRVLSLAQAEGVHVLFNAQYSPWLNPIENLFGQVKRRIKDTQIGTR